ncbi:hypothetical protein GCM10009819_03610 [Agromyces tropicus]|uniref:Secreted protein n=1 Tax=Agromyces tropicus TaxID=555371 RepID=A0ABN2TXX1_9MICO
MQSCHGLLFLPVVTASGASPFGPGPAGKRDGAVEPGTDPVMRQVELHVESAHRARSPQYMECGAPYDGA